MAELKDFDELLGNCLEALERGEGLADVLARYPQASEELKTLLEAAVWFSGQKAAVEPRPGFVKASRARLVEQIAAETVTTGNWLERMWVQLSTALGGGWRVALQVTLAVVILACLVVGGSGVALASQTALPGEALYPVKTSLENVELLVTRDTAAKIQLHNQFSQARLLEIEELVMEGRYNYIRETVSNFEAHVNRASQLLNALATRDPERAAELGLALKETLAGQRAFLSFLMAAVPQEVVPEMLRALGIAASGEITVQAAMDEAGRTALLTATATSTREDEPGATDAPVVQRSIQSPTPTLMPSSTLPATAPPTAAAVTATPSNTVAPTYTRTPNPARTPTPVPEQENPAPTYTSRPPTQPPDPTDPPEEEEPTRQPKKTKKPPPNPTRRPPRSTESPEP